MKEPLEFVGVCNCLNWLVRRERFNFLFLKCVYDSQFVCADELEEQVGICFVESVIFKIVSKGKLLNEGGKVVFFSQGTIKIPQDCNNR